VNWKKWLGMWVIVIVVGFYTTFVLQVLWNWFAVEALLAPLISYWAMYGLLMLAHLVFDKPSFESDEKLKRLAIMANASVPNENRREVDDALKAEEDNMGWKLGSLILSQAVTNTFALVLGWVIHDILV
jgi:hypothetical protein